MSVVNVEPAGAEVPELPTGVLSVQAPPDQVEAQGMGNILAMFIPMMGSMGVMVFMAFSDTSNPRMLLMGGGMIVAMLGMVGFNTYRQVSGHRQKVDTQRREYLAYLGELRTSVRTAARMQRRYTTWHLPDPRSLVLIAEEGTRLWERDLDAPEALNVRLGSSTQELSMQLQPPELAPLANPDAVCHSAVSRFIATHSAVDNLPLGVSIGEFSHIELAGDPAATRAAARAMIAHLATFLSPEALQIAVLCSERATDEWDWLKWLPHARSREESDALGPARLVTTSYADLERLLGEPVVMRGGFERRAEATQWPHVVLVVDGATLPLGTQLGSREGTAGVTVVTLSQSWGALTSMTTIRLALHPPSGDQERGVMELVMLDREPILAIPDAMGVEQAEAVARRMVRWLSDERPDAESPVGRADPKRAVPLPELLGIGDIRDFDPDRQWRRREGRDRLRVPFGVTPEGVPVLLDIKEAAHNGSGPHGLLIGATGSGKSEVLRTLVLALALTHPPEQLNFVLVDFKGGATFAGMADLPHVSAMISNLESELTLVDRMEDALRGEMVRRQTLLREAGNYVNVIDYEAARLAGTHQHPVLPALFIVLDEFSELLSAKPEFIDTFVAIGRLGRSLAIHLLLSSQRLEEGRLRGLDSHLSYRIGLRTFSGQESRSVLGVQDAYELPPIPGVGYLKVSTDSMTRFRSSYVGGPPARRSVAASAAQAKLGQDVKLLEFTLAAQQIETAPDSDSVSDLPEDAKWATMTELDIAIARMRGKGTPAHQVWLPPLETPETLDSLMPDLAEHPGLGLVSQRWRAAGPLTVPLGITDLPLEQRRETLTVDLSGSGGHFSVIGGPLSGKSTMLRTLVMSLSLTRTPAEVQFYILDFGGGTFAAFAGGAHIAGVATRDEPDVVFRMISEIEAIMADRERYFRANRVDSITTYRRARAEGKLDDGYGDVFLVIDGWAALRSDFEDIEQRLIALAARALTFGVHLIVASARWTDIRLQIRDLIASRLELRLGDPSDSEIDRKIAQQVPQKRPGRGLEPRGRHMLVGLPRADGNPDTTSLADGVAATLERIRSAWTGQPGPKLRLLPAQVSLDQVRALAPEPGQLALGVEESRLGPLLFDPRTDSHLFLFGDAKSGKSTFLRALAHEVMRTHTPDQAKFIVVDYRRALLGDIPAEYSAGYLSTREQATSDLAELGEFLRTRLPNDSVSPEQLRSRSWWQGAEIWVLVDDYDLVATASGNPVAALQPLMSQAQDIGLHIVVTRRSGGASRAMYEPVLQTMTELGCTGILLSGNPDEGALIGRIRPRKTPAGRAQVVSRDAGCVVAQLAWVPPAH